MTISKKWSSAAGIIEWHADVRQVVSVTEFEQYRSLPAKEYKLNELFTIAGNAYVVNEHGCLYSLEYESACETAGCTGFFSPAKGREFHWEGVIYRAYAVE